jgi:hypothetical protein
MKYLCLKKQTNNYLKNAKNYNVILLKNYNQQQLNQIDN